MTGKIIETALATLEGEHWLGRFFFRVIDVISSFVNDET